MQIYYKYLIFLTYLLQYPYQASADIPDRQHDMYHAACLACILMLGDIINSGCLSVSLEFVVVRCVPLKVCARTLLWPELRADKVYCACMIFLNDVDEWTVGMEYYRLVF